MEISAKVYTDFELCYKKNNKKYNWNLLCKHTNIYNQLHLWPFSECFNEDVLQSPINHDGFYSFALCYINAYVWIVYIGVKDRCYKALKCCIICYFVWGRGMLNASRVPLLMRNGAPIENMCKVWENSIWIGPMGLPWAKGHCPWASFDRIDFSTKQEKNNVSNALDVMQPSDSLFPLGFMFRLKKNASASFA